MSCKYCVGHPCACEAETEEQCPPTLPDAETLRKEQEQREIREIIHEMCVELGYA